MDGGGGGMTSISITTAKGSKSKPKPESDNIDRALTLLDINGSAKPFSQETSYFFLTWHRASVDNFS